MFNLVCVYLVLRVKHVEWVGLSFYMRVFVMGCFLTFDFDVVFFYILHECASVQVCGLLTHTNLLVVV